MAWLRTRTAAAVKTNKVKKNKKIWQKLQKLQDFEKLKKKKIDSNCLTDMFVFEVSNVLEGMTVNEWILYSEKYQGIEPEHGWKNPKKLAFQFLWKVFKLARTRLCLLTNRKSCRKLRDKVWKTIWVQFQPSIVLKRLQSK